ncbi:MAG: ABC transporter ATP-binding protein [Candidatus Latescibacterota bacterium]
MDAPLLRVEELAKSFASVRGGRGARLWALDGVTFAMARGEVLALVGESGSGKSTLAQLLVGLEQPTAGRILFEGREIAGLRGPALRALRRRVQMVFQDPYESLNPTMAVGETVAEPLVVHAMAPDPPERQRRVRAALEDVGLVPATEYLGRLPHELSGGQRQRVALASALVLEPVLLLADEPVSMLDVSLRAGILGLLSELRRRRGISVLFITHDLTTTAALADRVGVLYLGRIVEMGPAGRVLGAPVHPYTRALLAATPVTDPRLRRARTPLPGETPDPARIPPGCRFHPRCPLAVAACRVTDPRLEPVDQGQLAACLLARRP